MTVTPLWVATQLLIASLMLVVSCHRPKFLILVFSTNLYAVLPHSSPPLLLPLFLLPPSERQRAEPANKN